MANHRWHTPSGRTSIELQNPFTSARIQALTERVKVNTRQQLVQVTLDRTAENQKAIQALTGHQAPITQYVDGSLHKPLEQAQLFTLTKFEFLDKIVDEAIATLIRNSPVGPGENGHYRDDHWLFVNGRRRDATVGGVVQVMPGDLVVIVNARPYSRKLERGKRRRGSTDRRPGLSVQAPNGIYEVTAQELRSRFGSLASIRFVYRNVSGIPERTRSSRYPALEISERV